MVLAVGSPAPASLLLPCQINKKSLRLILQHRFGERVQLQGQLSQLADHIPASALLTLRDGDAIAILPSKWRPSLGPHLVRSFDTVADARARGYWSHPLHFHSNCWLLLWRPASSQPDVVFASGVQQWDPVRGTLLPALAHLPDRWWPSLSALTADSNLLHLLQANAHDARAATVLCANPWRCEQLTPAPWQIRTGDILAESHEPPSSGTACVAPRDRPRAARSRATLYGPGRLSSLIIGGLLFRCLWPLLQRGHSFWSLAILGCYLAAFGAPHFECQQGPASWTVDLSDAAALTAKLHETWWTTPLHSQLPALVPTALHCAWHRFPVWTGSVPSSLLIATDGSGRNGGSWAFIVWALTNGKWHRLGWEAAPLADTVWLPVEARCRSGTLASFVGELAALESAGLWLSALLDWWQLHMGTRPSSVTLAVDNAAALQIAAGHGQSKLPVAMLARQAWQSAQSRINTRFTHVHIVTPVS